jgi:hypothetical protein
LQETHAALQQSTRDQALAAEVAIAVFLAHPLGLLADVKGIGAKFANDVTGINTGAPASPTSAVGGAAAARGGNSYTVNVNGGVMTNAQTGKVVIDAVKSFNRASGPADIAVRPISGRY